MRIEKLYIKNFRGFESKEFSFSPEFNLIVGNNGLGKTSALEAVAIAIGSWFLGIRGYNCRNILDRDIRRETIFKDKNFRFQNKLPVVIEAIGSVGEAEAKPIKWTRELKSDAKHAKTLYKDAIKLKKISEATFELANSKNHPLPLIAYYGAGRLWQVPRDTEKLKSSGIKKQPNDFSLNEEEDADYFKDRFVGYKYSIDNRIDPKFLIRWMAYERRIEIDEEIESTAFRTVISAIKNVLPEVKSVRFSVRHGTLMFDFRDGKITFIPFSEESLSRK